jgi:hypothetical protein
MGRELILAQRGTRDQVFDWIAKLEFVAPMLTLGELAELERGGKLNVTN